MIILENAQKLWHILKIVRNIYLFGHILQTPAKQLIDVWCKQWHCKARKQQCQSCCEKVAKMLFINQLQNLAKVTFVLLTLGITIGSFPASASEEPITNPKPLNIPNGNIQDLEGLQAKTSSQWLGEGGEYDAFVNTPSDAYEPQMNAFVMRTTTINNFWNRASTNLADETREVDPNLGDPKRSGFRVPIVQF